MPLSIARLLAATQRSQFVCALVESVRRTAAGPLPPTEAFALPRVLLVLDDGKRAGIPRPRAKRAESEMDGLLQDFTEKRKCWWRGAREMNLRSLAFTCVHLRSLAFASVRERSLPFACLRLRAGMTGIDLRQYTAAVRSVPRISSNKSKKFRAALMVVCALG